MTPVYLPWFLAVWNPIALSIAILAVLSALTLWWVRDPEAFMTKELRAKIARPSGEGRPSMIEPHRQGLVRWGLTLFSVLLAVMYIFCLWHLAVNDTAIMSLTSSLANVVLGIILGVFSAIAAVFFAYQASSRFRKAYDASRLWRISIEMRPQLGWLGLLLTVPFMLGMSAMTADGVRAGVADFVSSSKGHANSVDASLPVHLIDAARTRGILQDFARCYYSIALSEGQAETLLWRYSSFPYSQHPPLSLFNDFGSVSVIVAQAGEQREVRLRYDGEVFVLQEVNGDPLVVSSEDC